VRLVADANVLLSAVVGGSAGRVLRHPGVDEVLATTAAIAEVHEYAVVLARKKRLPPDTVLTAVVTLPVVVVDRATYSGSLKEAERRIGKRDPDDVETLALALHLGCPVWSNDDDFEDAGIAWYTTAEILKQLDEAQP
jgi:predicted nucleic acid-binding protein